LSSIHSSLFSVLKLPKKPLPTLAAVHAAAFMLVLVLAFAPASAQTPDSVTTNSIKHTSKTTDAGDTGDTLTSAASAPKPRYTSFLFPRNPVPWQTSFAADASLTILPRIIVEESVRSLPLLGAAFRLGLPENFGFHARLRTILLTNYLGLGVSWSYSLGRFSAALHEMPAVWMGLGGLLEGFQSNALGPLNHAGITLGAAIGTDAQPDETLLSLRVEAVHSWGYGLNVGGTQFTRRSATTLRGVEIGLCLEQEVSSGGRLFVALRTAYSRPSFEAWVAFSDIEVPLFYPTILFGYAF
jgi:hypothetical protein